MKKTKLLFSVVLAITSVLILSPLYGADTFTFYGKLKTGGTPYNGTTQMTFNVYNESSQLQSGVTENITVTNGNFSVNLADPGLSVVLVQVIVGTTSFPSVRCTLPVNRSQTNWIDADKIKTGAITAAKIADGAITDSKLSSGSFSNITGVGTLSSISVTGGTITGITDLAVADGGTGASTVADARTNLGLGSISTQSASSVSITGGSVTGITDLAIADGGTGASSKTAAFDALSPMTTRGDIIYGGVSGTGTRLAKGTEGYVLTMGANDPAWAAASTGANTALSNLGSVAVNTSLVSDANNTDDLGTDTYKWKDLYLAGIIKGSNIYLDETYDSTIFGIGAGNSGTSAGIYNTFIGYNAGYSNTTGTSNTATGYQALYTNTTSVDSTAVGYKALYANTVSYNTAVGSYALTTNSTGTNNAAVGYYALQANTIGTDNTAIGLNALRANTTGTDNTAVGSSALLTNGTGTCNTAVGSSALLLNTTGTNNAAVGFHALLYNGTGTDNTAVGSYALKFNTTGTDNTAVGSYALQINTTGSYNTAVGKEALNNTTGRDNTAIGYQALYTNTTSIDSTAVGYKALYANTVSCNTAVGSYALTTNSTGTNNAAVGYYALKANTIGTDNTAIGLNALQANTTGTHNTANGSQALYANTIGTNNTAIGYYALGANTTGTGNTAIGDSAGYAGTAITVGTNNTFIGYSAQASSATLTNATAIGHSATVSADNSLVLGSGANVGIGVSSPLGRLHSKDSGAKTADTYAGYLENASTNTTTGGISKYGLYIDSSSGNFTGDAISATVNYGMFIVTTANADTNYDIYAGSGANLSTGGSWNPGSSRKYKQQISSLKEDDFDGLLGLLDNVNMVYYKYNIEVKEKGDSARQHIGVIAEDTPDILTDDDKKSLSSTDIMGFLLAVAKAQQKQINQLSGKEIQKQLKETEVTKQGDLVVRNDSKDRDLLFEVNQGGTPVDAMMIDGSTGNIGMGVSSPVTKLEVNGTIKSSGSDSAWTTSEFGKGFELVQGNALIWDEEGGTIARGISVKDDKFYLLRSTESDISSDPIYDMVIDENGNMGIGTDETEDYKLTVDGNTNIQGTISAEKGYSGYVINKFLNSSGDTLKRGDLVKIKPSVVSQFTGIDNLIPIPEVTLTEADDEYGVVGIVLGHSNSDIDSVPNGGYVDVVIQGTFALCKVKGTVHGGSWLISSAGGYAKEGVSTSENRVAMALESYIPGESPSEYIAVLVK